MRTIFENDELYFVPLGGSEEFGTNLNLYVCDGDFLIADCGIGFADERFPGIDLLLPDTKFLQQKRDKIKGMIITHAHEDHIGAVCYVWEKLKCPVYALPFTASVLRKKLDQHGVNNVPIHVVNTKDTVSIGTFDVDFIPVSHSVPDSCSLFIQTRHGNVVHSGDWNLDPAPVIGEKTQEDTFRALSKKGVLAYVGDSTNSQVDGYSGSEADVAKGMAEEFKKCDGKIAVTTFASNIGRLISIVKAAEENGRSVALVGRSLHRMVGCAYECSYINDIPDFLSEDDIAKVPDENLVLVLTGSQGEHRAAMARVARGDHPFIRLNKRDTVIFSSRTIPGNERRINVVKNDLSAAGVRVVSPKETQNTIHVSGHPCRDEIASMLQWVQPACVIPVHGERLQLDTHAQLAQDCQVNHTLVPSNGSVIRLAPNLPEIIDHIETGNLAVDQRRIIPVTHQSITARRKLQYSGTVHASVVLNQDLEVIGNIKVDTVGLSCKRNEDCIIPDLQDHIFDTLDQLDDDLIYDEEKIAERLRGSLRRYVMDTLGLRPKTTIHVTLIDL
ncbi:MAG: ribonuclease J [Alphaproteobacteria bacterium]